jgi:hypothetical protein
MFNKNNINNNYNYNSQFNYNDCYNNNNININIENDINKINSNKNNISNIKIINQEENIPNKNIKVKNQQKRINYIPKNLLSFNSLNQDLSQSNNQEYYRNLPNMYYNNLLSSEHKNSFDSQNSKKRNNSNNYYGSPNEVDKNFRNIINDINVNSNENEENYKNYNNIMFKAFFHIFDANINEVREILTDNLLFKNNCSHSVIDNISFTKNNFSSTEGNIISFRWKKFYTLELICTKAFFSKTYIYYTLTLVNLKPVNIGNLEMNFKYYYNTCQNNTLFIIEYVLDKGILSEVFKEEFLEKDMTDICTSCQNIINQRKKERNHLSTIFFNTSKEIAWKFIMNLDRNKYCNYMNEYDLIYMSEDNIEFDNTKENNSIKKGDIIIIKRKKI